MKSEDRLLDDVKTLIWQEIPLLEGWLTPERGFEMASLIIKERPSVVVEVGIFGGRSLIAQALALDANGKGYIFGVDPWRVDDALEGENSENQKWWKENVDLNKIHQGCMEAVWRLRLDYRAIICRSQSQYAHRVFRDLSVDILNIDGNHSEVASCRDVRCWFKRVKTGGYIWFDDTNWDSTQTAQRMLEKSCDTLKDGGTYKLYQKRCRKPSEDPLNKQQAPKQKPIEDESDDDGNVAQELAVHH